MRKVKVLLEPKKKMHGYMGMNKHAAKKLHFPEKVSKPMVKKTLRKKVRHDTEKHEYIEDGLIKRGMNYKPAHKIALKREKKPLKGVQFVEVKAKTKKKRKRK